MAMAINYTADKQWQSKNHLDGSILDNLMLRFPSGLVLGDATCFFLQDVELNWYSSEKISDGFVPENDDSTGAIMVKTIKHRLVLKKGDPYPIEKYDEDKIFLCDIKISFWQLLFKNKMFGVRIKPKKVKP